MTAARSVLFVCVHNAGRSQMAAGYLTHLSGGAVEVRSAGSQPADTVNPAAVAAMAEVGIDITAEVPKILTTDAVQASDVVITMGCGDTCPIFPGKRYEDWTLDDPAGQGVDAVRPIRDEIRRRVVALLAEHVGPVTGHRPDDGSRPSSLPTGPRSRASTPPASPPATRRSRPSPRTGRPSTPPSSPTTGGSPSAMTARCSAGSRSPRSPTGACTPASSSTPSTSTRPRRAVGWAGASSTPSPPAPSAAGIWTIQSGMFPENAASLVLHRAAGFRVVGTRERVGRMTHGPLAGSWRDVVLLERRSSVAGAVEPAPLDDAPSRDVVSG